MHVTMFIVASADGKMARGNEPNVHAWTSKEDAAFFTSMIAKHDCIVMGRKTFEAVRPRPTKEVLRVVMTHRPQAYKDLAIPGSLEFTSEQPQALADRLGQAGYASMMLVGGREIYTAFLYAGLVDEFYLTIEPVLFAVGANMFADLPLNVRIELVDVRRLNDAGTVLLRYRLKQQGFGA